MQQCQRCGWHQIGRELLRDNCASNKIHSRPTLLWPQFGQQTQKNYDTDVYAKANAGSNEAGEEQCGFANMGIWEDGEMTMEDAIQIFKEYAEGNGSVR